MTMRPSAMKATNTMTILCWLHMFASLHFERLAQLRIPAKCITIWNQQGWHVFDGARCDIKAATAT